MLSDKVRHKIEWARKNRSTELDLSNCDLTEIPQEVFELDRLLDLRLSSNSIKTIPKEIEKLHRLRKLYLHWNFIEDLPTSFGALKNLEYLNLSDNSLMAIPDCFFELRELKEVYLENNKIAEIPSKIRNLQNLTRLVANDNQIKEIPKELGKLPLIEKIVLSNNRITHIGRNTFVSSSLEDVILINNNIKCIEINAFKGDKLLRIFLEKNDIDIIENRAFNGEKIFYINLENNRLNFLPQNLGKLPVLNGLYLGNNLFQDIPQVIGGFEKINEVNLENNPITGFTEKEFVKKLVGKEEITSLKNYLNTKYNITFRLTNLHQEIYNYLRTNFPKRVFQISFQKSRIKQGLYLLGENSCILSLWEGKDKVSKTPNIYWEVDLHGNIVEVISAQDHEEKANFLRGIATTLNYRQEKEEGKSINVWKKMIKTGGALNAQTMPLIFETLEAYIKKTAWIDLFLEKQETVKDLDLIDRKAFEKNVDLINELGGQKKDVVVEKSALSELSINHLQLKNIGHFENIQIDLSKQVTCLIGENGAGKTTVLRAILLGLVGVDETDKIDETAPVLQQMLRIKNDEYTAQGDIFIHYENGKRYENHIQFQRDQNEIKLEDIPPVQDISSFGIVKNNNELKHLILGFSQFHVETQANGNGALKFKDIRPNVGDLTNLIENKPNNQFESLFKWIYRLHNASQNRSSDTDDPANSEVVIDLIFSVISKIVGNKVTLKKVDKYHKQEIWVETGERDRMAIPFTLLSQGFKNVFAWVGHFIRRLAETYAVEKGHGYFDFTTDFAQQNAIVVIDEVTTYLHPKWQRNILSALVDSFPKVQFIITTHSPLVISNLNEEYTNVYLINKNGAHLLENFYGRDIRDVMYEFYGVKARPAVIQSKINEMFRFIQIENIEEAEKLFEELKKHLGEEDGAIISATTSLDLIAAGL